MAITLLSFLIFIGSIIYLLYFLISKMFVKDKILPKKKFAIGFFGSAALFITSISLNDPTTAEKLEIAQAENLDLTNEVTMLKQSNEELNL